MSFVQKNVTVGPQKYIFEKLRAIDLPVSSNPGV